MYFNDFEIEKILKHIYTFGKDEVVWRYDTRSSPEGLFSDIILFDKLIQKEVLRVSYTEKENIGKRFPNWAHEKIIFNSFTKTYRKF